MKNPFKVRDFEIVPHGDRALDICFGDEISAEINRRVMAVCAALDERPIEGVINAIPAYCALTVEFDPAIISREKLVRALGRIKPGAGGTNTGRTVTIPVCYGGEFGPDLKDVARHAGLSEREVIARHTAPEYRVYMLGFRPGFAYLGGLDQRIATPRRETPRPRIEPGSVGIAGAQTGVYPEASPGGWNIIGRTALSLYDDETGALLRPGDALRFKAVSEEKMRRLICVK